LALVAAASVGSSASALPDLVPRVSLLQLFYLELLRVFERLALGFTETCVVAFDELALRVGFGQRELGQSHGTRAFSDCALCDLDVPFE